MRRIPTRREVALEFDVLSFIIPAHNEELLLPETLRILRASAALVGASLTGVPVKFFVPVTAGATLSVTETAIVKFAL